MSAFTEARTELYRPGGLFQRPLVRLLDDLAYDIGYKGSGLTVRAKAGFITDLGSDPTGILDLTGVALLAKRSFIVHDLLRENILFSKLASDAIFLMAMEAEGVPELPRELIFAAVRTNHSRRRRNPDELVFGAAEMPPY